MLEVLYHHAKLEDCDTEVGLIIVLQRNIVLEFGKITKNNGHYAVQGHSSSPILVRYDFLLVINTNLPSILPRFRDIAF